MAKMTPHRGAAVYLHKINAGFVMLIKHYFPTVFFYDF